MDELKKAGGPGYAMLIADYSHPIKSFGTKNCQAAVKRMIKKLRRAAARAASQSTSESILLSL